MMKPVDMWIIYAASCEPGVVALTWTDDKD